jgi:hypothetical protein
MRLVLKMSSIWAQYCMVHLGSVRASAILWLTFSQWPALVGWRLPASDYHGSCLPYEATGPLHMRACWQLYNESLKGITVLVQGNAMVNEVAMEPDLKDQLGSINGAGQTMSSLMRAIGPSVAGLAWSLVTAADMDYGPFLPFWALAVMTAMIVQLYYVA